MTDTQQEDTCKQNSNPIDPTYRRIFDCFKNQAHDASHYEHADLYTEWNDKRHVDETAKRPKTHMGLKKCVMRSVN